MGVNKRSQQLMMKAWAPNTLQNYNVQERKWITYCFLHKIDAENPPLRTVIDFLSGLTDKGMSYQSVNCARSALSSFLPHVDNQTVGKTTGVRWLLKGTLNENPPLAIYNATWDVDILLDYLREWSPLCRLTLKQLSYKLVCLLLVTSCQRVQSITALKVSGLIQGSEDIVFRLSSKLKHNTRGYLQLLEFKPFNSDPRICVVRTIKEYLARTSDIRNGQDQLVLSHAPPYHVVGSSRISHWVREVLQWAGIDSSVFSTHSIRGAVSSQLLRLNVPVKTIMQKASWKSESTFRQFYNKPLMDQDPSQELLHAYTNSRIRKSANKK